MTNSEQKPKDTKEMNADQYAMFLKYWGMGASRSLEKLRELLLQESTADTPERRDAGEKVPAIDTLKDWSGKFAWQAKILEMDEEANKQLYEEAMGAARGARVDILKIFKAVVLRFATQLKEQKDRQISSADIATFWKMVRVEMDLPTDRPDITSGGKRVRSVVLLSQEEEARIENLFGSKPTNGQSHTDAAPAADHQGGTPVPQGEQAGSAYERRA